MSGAFTLLKADGKMVRYLAIGPEAEGDHELLTALARSSPDLQRRGRLSRRGRNSNEEGTSSRPSGFIRGKLTSWVVLRVQRLGW